MNSKTAKLISPERVRKLLECYGANAQAWPEDERASALALIQHSSELQNLRQQAHAFDVVLSAGDNRSRIDAPADPKLVARIVDGLPEQDRAASGSKRNRLGLAGLTDSRSLLSLAAATAAVFVISLSIMNIHTSSLPREQPARVSAELDDWMWEQVTGEPLDEEEGPATFMALLELEES